MRALLAAATTLNGILAGANADRLIVGMPALRKLGPRTWADYSRNADLAPSGMAFYPTLAIGGTLLTIAAACSGRLQPAERRLKPAPTLAAVCALSGLLLTFKAAPNMLAVRKLGQDAEALQQRLDRFVYWSRLRGALQIGAFVAGVCALSASRP